MNTIYVPSKSHRKQVSIQNYAVSKIMDITESSGSLSKGLVAYESLLLINPEYSDPYSPVEEVLLNRIKDYYGAEVSDFFHQNKMAKKSEVMGDLERECRYDEPHGTMMNSTFYLPESFLKANIEGRGLGFEIGDAVVKMVSCPYDDRLERSSILTNLISLYECESDSTHAYVSSLLEKATLSTESPEGRIGSVISDTLSGESQIDEKGRVEKPWMDDEFSLSDVKSLVNTEEWPDDRNSRIDAVSSALTNTNQLEPSFVPETYNSLVSKVRDVTGYGSRAARSYVGEMVDSDLLELDFYTETEKEAIKNVEELIAKSQGSWIDHGYVLSEINNSDLAGSPAAVEYHQTVIKHNNSLQDSKL